MEKWLETVGLDKIKIYATKQLEKYKHTLQVKESSWFDLTDFRKFTFHNHCYANVDRIICPNPVFGQSLWTCFT